MTRTRRIEWLAVLLMFVGTVGCGKSEEPAPSAAAPNAAPAVVSNSPGTSLSKGSSASTSPSGVVPAAAVRPVVQADPIVQVHTSVGDLYVRLYEKQAPRTVSNFFDYVRVRHYDGTIFHQIDAGYVALGGSLDQQRQPKSVRYPIPNEATNGLKNVRGSVAMARDPQNVDSATSGFFFNLADNPKLDHRGTTPGEYGYCVFGQVIDGLDVLDKLSSAESGKVVILGVKLMPQRDNQVLPAQYQTNDAVRR